MKKGKKEVLLAFRDVTVDAIMSDCSTAAERICTYTFTCDELIDVDFLRHFVEIDVPETISEFREIHDLSKEQLLDWLKEHYK